MLPKPERIFNYLLFAILAFLARYFLNNSYSCQSPAADRQQHIGEYVKQKAHRIRVGFLKKYGLNP
jgi:hypothetical protein